MRLKDPDKVELIFKATLDLVSRDGLASLTMASISRASNLGMGTIYVYFKSKEDLINALYRKLKAGNTARIMRGLSLDDALPLKLRCIYFNYLNDRVLQISSHYFIEQAGKLPFLDEQSLKIKDESFKELEMLLLEGQHDLLIKKLPVSLLIAQAMGAANEIAGLIVSGVCEFEQVADDAFKLCWDSLKS